jgi:hypothetical protein
MLRHELSTELDKLTEDILYTEKSHFAAADEWGLLHTVIGGLTTVSAAASAATIISTSIPALAAVLALVAAIGGALQTFLRFGDSRDAALTAGRELGELRVRIRQMKNLRLPATSDAELGELVPLVAELAASKAEIDSRSPISSQRHYVKGRKRIERGEFG